MVRRAHAWVGALTGLYLGLVGLTGIGLVVAPTLFAWEYGLPSLPEGGSGAAQASLDRWIERAEDAFGDLPAIESFNAPLATPLRIAAPTMMYSTMRDDGPVTGVIVVEPRTGAPLAHFVAQDSWAFWPLRLHMAMFLPFAVMWKFLAASAWLLLALSLTGLLALPNLRRRGWLPRPRLADPATLRQLHLAIGLLASPLLLVAGATGLLMTDKALAKAVWSTLGATEEISTPPPCHPSAPLSPGSALSIAQSQRRGSELGALEPLEEGGYRVWLRGAGERVPARGDFAIALDACGSPPPGLDQEPCSSWRHTWSRFTVAESREPSASGWRSPRASPWWPYPVWACQRE